LGESGEDVTDPDVVFGWVARIDRAVSVPVTADPEAGYWLDPPAELIERLLDAGAVGCNLEDTDHHGEGVLGEAVPAAVAGGSPLDPKAARVVLDAQRGPESPRLSLSVREAEALQHVRCGRGGARDCTSRVSVVWRCRRTRGGHDLAPR
jgi:hypothetical protein